jgi:hypothetical protein
MAAQWFSACLRLLVLVDGAPQHYADSLVVIRAADWDAAFNRALDVGRNLERSYTNSEGEPVEWRLKEILTLDEIGDELTDGREVYFTRTPLPDGEPDARTFRPEESRPTQSGV